MPRWKTHIEVAKKCNEFLNFNDIDYMLFVFGSILPDINNRYIIPDIETYIDRDYTHYKYDSNNKIHENFYNEHKENIKDPIILGYYTHLYTDYSFNNFSYPFLKNEKSLKDFTKDELRRFKQDEFRKYNTNFTNNKITIYDANILLENLNKIDRVKLNKNDIDKITNYLDKNEEALEMTFFNKNDFDILIGNIVNEIKNFYFNK